MGIFCQINLFKPPDGVFGPCSTVSGIIKYALDEETVFSQITISLKGIGRLLIQNHALKKYNSKTETYVDIDNVILNTEKAIPAGSYETEFCFQLPHNIPMSLKYKKDQLDSISCKIVYYIRIKFERGLMKFQKKFKKDIIVMSGITPKLPMNPVICGQQKTLTKFFSSKKSVVEIKAKIEKCVFGRGEKIKLDFEVINDTSLKINETETKLIEMHHFVAGFEKIDIAKTVIGTESLHGPVEKGANRNASAEIYIPLDRLSLENSKIVSRHYIVYIIAELPLPHRNAVLEIPIQIGDINIEPACNSQPPPSYWEAMSEEVKEFEDFDDKKEKSSEKKQLF